MSEDFEKKEEEEKLEFTAEGEALGYISLDQARVLALRTARDEPDFYGPVYSQRNLIREVLESQEGEDYYQIRLSYRPADRFNGTAGAELFTIDKLGGIESRQLLAAPRPKSIILPALSILTGLVVVGALSVGLYLMGVFSPGVTGMAGGLNASDRSAVHVYIEPDATANLVSPDGEVSVSVPVGSVKASGNLTYSGVTRSELPKLPDGAIAVPKAFDLSLVQEADVESVDKFASVSYTHLTLPTILLV